MGPLRSFLFGLALPAQALRLILRKKSLLFWSLLPLGLTLSLSIWGVQWLQATLVGIGMRGLADFAPGFGAESLTVKAVVVLMQIVLYVLAALCFSFLAGILASPFNDFLSEATEPHCLPALPPLAAETRTIRWKIRTIRIDIVKTFLVSGTQLFLLGVGILGIWIPGFSLIPLALGCWLLSFQFISYPQTRRGDGFGTSLLFLFRHPFACLGFGISIGFLFTLPVLSSLSLPLAVVGGTLLYSYGSPDSSGRPRRP